MSSQLEALRLFVRVARLGNFSRAARDLCLSQPKTSRLISQLERELGAVLFLRTTRSVALTDAGQEYLTRIEPLLRALEDANRSVRQSTELRGELRVALTPSIATRLVLPLLSSFLRLHEELRIEAAIEEEVDEPAVRGFDALVRASARREWPDTAIPMRAWPRLLVAAPSLLERGGEPTTPRDVEGFAVLSERSTRVESWVFRKGLQRTACTGRVRLVISQSEGLVAAAVAGAGLLATIAPACQREMERGQLVRVLPQWDFGTVLVYAQFVGNNPTPAARAFVRYLQDHLRARSTDAAQPIVTVEPT